jgi:hypothetical protein
LVKEHRWTSGVELGVLHGRTLQHLLNVCPSLRMIAVDTWAHGDKALDPPANGRRTEADSGYRSYADVDMEEAYQGVQDLAARHPRRLLVMRTSTALAAEHVPDRSQDFVFFDADHTADGLERDIMTWRRVVRPTGWLLGHDYDYHSVATVIDRLLPWHDRLPGAVWAIPVADVTL